MEIFKCKPPWKSGGPPITNPNHALNREPLDSHRSRGLTPSKWIRPLDEGPIFFFFNMKPLNL